MDAAKPPVQCGDILAGKYRVEALLGKGGMGFVVAARHVQLEQRVAVKFMRPEALEADGARQRFERESRAAVRLRSEHVARVLDVGMLEDNSPYIVMEYLEGSNLRTLLKQRTRLGCDEAATYIMQACEAVAEAHALGMVHRDIKPTNLFLTYTPTGRPCVKVLDFGIVKTLEGSKDGDGLDEATLTKTQAALGSPRYMAPEQVASAKKVDRRSDVWALGACLYQFVTGKPAFQAENLLELGAKIVHEDPVDPKELRPDLPPALAQIILCCLDKVPERRFPDARQLGMALEQYLSPSPSVPVSAGAPTSSPVEVAVPIPRSSPTTDRISPIDPFIPSSSPMIAAPPSRAEDTGPSQNGSAPGRTGVTWEGSSAPTGEFRRPPTAAKKMPIAIAVLTLFAFVGAGLGGLALWARHSRAQAQATAAPLPPPPAVSAIPKDTATATPPPPPEETTTTLPAPSPTETVAAAPPSARDVAPAPTAKPTAVVRPKPTSVNTPTAQPKPASSRAFDHL